MLLRVRAPLVIAVLVACGGHQRVPLGPAGGDHDEGAGQLARASLRLETEAGDSAEGFRDDRPNAAASYPYGGEAYGGDGYGGDPYGGASYAGWRAPQWRYQAPNRTPHYQVSGGLTGVIEGVVSWGGAPP